MSSNAAKAAGAVLSGQYDDGLTTFYEVLPDASPTHIQHNGIGRTAVQFLTGASGLGIPVKSVRLRFRKYGLPTGPITVNIRKGSDDTIAATIGSFDIQHFPQGVETELSIRNRFHNTYNMVANDSVSVEFPSNATNGFEITTHSTAGNPSNYTSRSYNGTAWSSTSDPLCITIKG
jgi:hypothetical protein